MCTNTHTHTQHIATEAFDLLVMYTCCAVSDTLILLRVHVEVLGFIFNVKCHFTGGTCTVYCKDCIVICTCASVCVWGRACVCAYVCAHLCMCVIVIDNFR